MQISNGCMTQALKKVTSKKIPDEDKHGKRAPSNKVPEEKNGYSLEAYYRNLFQHFLLINYISPGPTTLAGNI